MIDLLPGKARKVAYSSGVLYFVVDTKAPDPVLSSIEDVLHALEAPGVWDT